MKALHQLLLRPPLPPHLPRLLLRPTLAKTTRLLRLPHASWPKKTPSTWPASLAGTGKGGRITKEDVVAAVANKKAAPAAAAAKPAAAAAAPVVATGDRTEKRVPMTRVRATVAKRLVEAQSNMAMLTTFNEVDMTEVMALRSKYKDLFEKSHNGVRLGFMSFFVKAATEALKRFPGCQRLDRRQRHRLPRLRRHRCCRVQRPRPGGTGTA